MNEYIQKLKEKGLKATPKRLAIIDFFAEKNSVLTPEEVWVPLKKRFGQLGLPSVYRNLEALTECGILTRIHKFDNKRHYALCHDHCSHSHHHHIVCNVCGKVGEFEDCHLESLNKIKGFKIVKHFVQLEGVCADCQ